MLMDKRFIAKTRPIRKDIQTHIDDLLHNLEILRALYPNLKIDWDMLRFACIYHDLGKMYGKFQLVVQYKSKDIGIPHGLLSLGFIDVVYLEKKGYDEIDIKILFHAIAYHHDRYLDYSIEYFYNEIATLTDVFKEFEYSKLPTRFLEPKFDITFYKPGQRLYEYKDDRNFFKYIMLKGILNRLDYAASAGIDVEEKNDFLMDSMANLLNKYDIKWNLLQEYMLRHQQEDAIVIAQTGMGKTEAGLLWIGDDKGVFTLPLKSAINAIYNRIKKKIVTEKADTRVGLLHSDTLKVYSEQNKKILKEENIDDGEWDSFMDYYNRTRQLSLPLTICTLDQIFDFVYRYKGFEHKLATLSYSKVVIDEIQMYSPELVAYLILGLSYIKKVGGQYAILTATLPELILDFMKEEGLNPPKPAVFTNSLIRHSMKIIAASIDTDESIAQMEKSFSKNKILVVCNTIKKAKEVYKKLKKVLREEDKSKIYLLHSGFIKNDRDIKELKIMETGKEDSKISEIWVCTQLVEASLDIDFDLLFTELSDLNGLFQRMGRCYRHRVLDVDYNCFVFTGGSQRCSGVGENSVIEPEIHKLSMKALKTNGVICEKCKVQMVKEVYSTKTLQHTQYYTKIKNTLDYVKNTTEFEYTKAEVNKMFRNIDQISVIPLSIYGKNEIVIKEYIEILKNRTKSIYERTEAREKIRGYMVSVDSRIAEKTCYSKHKIEKNFMIIVIDADYNDEMGISFIRTKNDEYKNIEDRML